MSDPGTLRSGGFSNSQLPVATAALALGYSAANPNRVQAPAQRTGINPNSTFSQIQRQRLSLEGLNAVKNTPFAINYICKRLMYCSPGPWCPDTGDHALDAQVSEVLEMYWETMGFESSMRDAFNQAANVFQPQNGDCLLQIGRDEDNRLRLFPVTADRIGEVYNYSNPALLADGSYYFGGLVIQDNRVIRYKVYDRVGDYSYVNARMIEAKDAIFFKDDFSGGARGVSKFFGALEDINSRYQILKSTKDTMQQQSKIAAIASNNSGAPSEYTYETQNNQNGSIEFVQSYADGAVERWMFNGDSYQFMKGEHPTDTFINGMKYLDASAAGAMGFPYEFLFGAAESGGAPARFAFEAAGKEILRIRAKLIPPLRRIARITINDCVDRGLLPPRANIHRGSFQWCSLPTADAFRDSLSDIKEVRAGLNSPQRVIATNLGASAQSILSETTAFAIMVAKAVEDGNRQLVADGYKPTLTAMDISQTSDNPQQSAAADNIVEGKPASGAEPAAKPA